MFTYAYMYFVVVAARLFPRASLDEVLEIAQKREERHVNYFLHDEWLGGLYAKEPSGSSFDGQPTFMWVNYNKMPVIDAGKLP